MNIALLRNKQLLALLIVAIISALIIFTLVMGLAFHINVWHFAPFMPGKAILNGFG